MKRRIAMPDPPSPAHHAPWSGLVALGLMGVATWALSHPYLGLFHDAGVYALQALARLHPDSLSADVFLEFGSQDRFTLWSPVYATFGRWLGMEQAAAWLTFGLQITLLACAWTLARTAVGASTALLGVTLLIAFPGNYGAGRVFGCIESFLTPRMAAEALVLAALAAALRDRKVLSVMLVAAAAACHPLMALAGVAALYWLYLGERHPVVALALVIVGLKALALAALVMPFGTWGRFDAGWLGLVGNRSPYLFLSSWSLDDWSRAAVPAATLLAGWVVLPDRRGRVLCKMTVITALSGVTLTLLGCDLLHSVSVTQAQPWRWQWLSTAIAALLLPEILRVLWGGSRGRLTAAILLICAWLFADNTLALVAAAAALTALSGLDRLKPAEARWPFLGAIGLLVIAVAWRCASNLEFTDAHYADPVQPSWMRTVASFAHDGSAPAALLFLAWWIAGRPSQRPVLVLTAAFASAACAALYPETSRAWEMREFTTRRTADFAAWRAQIPLRSSVFWPESPLAVWMLLDRASYLSVLQTSGLVFSRSAAFEMQRRAAALAPAVDPAVFMNWSSGGTALHLTAAQLDQVCRSGAVEFLVTRERLGREPLAVDGSASASSTLRLYRCAP